MKVKILLILFLFQNQFCISQICSGEGQRPTFPIPLCGFKTYTQNTVGICNGKSIVVPCSNISFKEKNSFWYSFKCYNSGEIGFIISPTKSTDNYDWQLFDVSFRDPNDVYEDSTLFTACNWSSLAGETGANFSGTSLVVCAANSASSFSKMPNIIMGHTYLLLVNNSQDTQDGYTINFINGGALITDPAEPHLDYASGDCNGSKIYIKLNKKIKCTSIDLDGSDFAITPALARIIGSGGTGCDMNQVTDSIQLTLSNVLPPGDYTVTIQTGADGNNLLDVCDNSISPIESVRFKLFPQQPSDMEQIVKNECTPKSIKVIFKDPVRCNSIAPDGSDFFITGPFGINIISAKGDNCGKDELSNTIFLEFSSPIVRAGNFLLNLTTGTDGNTIINECGRETPAGNYISFTTADTVSASIQYKLSSGCEEDTIAYKNNMGNGVNKWLWNFDNSISALDSDTVIIYKSIGKKTATLIVSNGRCNDTSTVFINLDNKLTAAFEAPGIICPGDPVTFKDKSFNNIAKWQWDFGNNITSIMQVPPTQFYPVNNNNSIKDIVVRLIVSNQIGCSDTTENKIGVADNCYIAVPKAFTPNGDGLNDFLYPINSYKAKDLYFAVYNRSGQNLFETKNRAFKWDGTFKGIPQDPGTYVWVLKYIDIDNGKKIYINGTSLLLR